MIELTDRNVNVWFKGIELSLSDTMNKIVLDFWTDVVYTTPVDTGRAKQSWNISLKEPNIKVPSGISYIYPSTPIVNFKGFDYRWCTSSLEYMTKLEQGYSKQGSHMTERAINNILQELNEEF